MNRMLLNCSAIGVGGFCGALARYGVALLFGNVLGARSFPIATLVINVTGSAFLGWFYTMMGARPDSPGAATLRLAVATGFVGAYTTFSTYMYETDSLLRDDREFLAICYLLGSLLLGLIGVRLGVMLAQAR